MPFQAGACPCPITAGCAYFVWRALQRMKQHSHATCLQREGVKFALRRGGRVLIGDEMGLVGASLQVGGFELPCLPNWCRI